MLKVLVFISHKVICDMWMEANHKSLLIIARNTSQTPFLHLGEQIYMYFSYIYDLRSNWCLGNYLLIGMFLIAELCNWQFSLAQKYFKHFEMHHQIFSPVICFCMYRTQEMIEQDGKASRTDIVQRVLKMFK